MQDTAVVIGAGVAGLACAIDLAAKGTRVIVLERAASPGGKARTIEVAGREIDAGPTVFTMPWVFEELFDDAGADFRDAVPLERAEVLARHFWEGGTRLDLFADDARSADAIGDVFGAREARAFRAFQADTARIFEIAEGPFLRGPRMTLPGIIKRFGAAGIATLAKLDSHQTMWRALERRFHEPKLRQLFGRYATYVGSSPFEAPATLNLIAHVESQGVYRAAGGMRALVRALATLAERLGVELRTDAEVERVVVEGGRARGVVSRGERIDADAVVFAGDVSALGAGLFGSDAARAASETRPDARSLSAVTWAIVADTGAAPLLHHNVFFSNRYRDEFDDLFARGRAPDAPTVYVCAQDRQDGERERGSERLLVISNAPPDGDRPGAWDEGERERCTKAMEGALERHGVTWARVEAPIQTTPAEFHRLFPGTGGALYGPRSKGSLSFLSRAGSATKVPGLYLAGGSVHPGAGVPMAALSGRLAASRIREDRASTGRSPLAAIFGIT